jgi:hypothetical protein
LNHFFSHKDTECSIHEKISHSSLSFWSGVDASASLVDIRFFALVNSNTTPTPTQDG